MKPPEVDSGVWESLPLELKREVVLEYEEGEKREAAGSGQHRTRE